MRFVRWYRKELALVFIRKATARKMRAEQVLRLYGQDTGSLHYAAA